MRPSGVAFVMLRLVSQLAPRSRGRDADPLTGGRDSLGPTGGVGGNGNGTVGGTRYFLTHMQITCFLA